MAVRYLKIELLFIKILKYDEYIKMNLIIFIH